MSTASPPPKGIFLLGPDEWDGRPGLQPPKWPEDRESPKDLRLWLAARIETDAGGALRAVVMDASRQRAGESHAAFFHRLEVENHVTHYFIVVPPNCKILGTVFEGGMLERDFVWGAHPAISLFLHTSTATEDPDTNATQFIERGRRTRYLESLADHADDIVFWDGVGDLEMHVIKRARSLSIDG